MNVSPEDEQQPFIYNVPIINYIYKCILLGDANTGKTTINQVYIKSNKAFSFYEPTIGIDFGSKTFEIPPTIKLYAWDTAGQEKFRSIIQSYYKNVCFIVLVYDITRRKSFDNLFFWLNELNRYNKCNHSHPVLLIGTKADLESKREVSYQEAYAYAQRNHFDFIEINSFVCQGLNEKFIKIIKEIYHSDLLKDKCSGIRLMQNEDSINPGNGKSININDNELNTRCCQ